MYDIEVANRMVYQDLTDKLAEKLSAGRIGKFIANFADFDSTFFQVVCEDRKNIIVSLQLSYWHILEESNVIGYLDDIYGKCVSVTRLGEARAETDMVYNISLNIDIDELAAASEDDREHTIREVSKLRRNCFAAAFNVHFEAHKARQNTTEVVIPFRDQETMFIKAKSDHVVVIFSTTFKDKTDQVLAKEFLQSFHDAKIGSRAGLNPPNVILSKDPPKEIATHDKALTGDHVYYLTFVLQNAHVEQDKKASNTIDLIHTFRTYLHYHIKCSKAYIHARMRKKTAEFEQILNRAKPEKKTKVQEKYG